MAEDAALDGAELEATGQVSDWVDLKETREEEDGEKKVFVIGRARLTFIPAAFWTSILSRQEVLQQGAKAVRARLEEGTSEDASKDAQRFGVYKTTLLEVAGETVARSLREIEGREPFAVVNGHLSPEDVESLALEGLFWSVHNAIVEAHWTSPDQARALFRGWVGKPV
jgi:hypothetical protein